MGVVSPPLNDSPSMSQSKSIFSPMMSDITMSNVSAATMEEIMEAGSQAQVRQ